MKRNKKKSSLMLLLLLVLGVTVGYAFLSTTLNINGTTKVKNATWNIYWDNANVTDGSVTTTKPTIDSSKTTATFNVELEKPGDFYEFTIDAKNDGTIDGMISAISYKLNDTEISLGNPLPAYLNYTVTYSDDVALEANQILAANTKETYKVRVEFKKNIENNQLPGSEVTLSLKFAVTYVQADGNATETHPSAITYITRQNEGAITPGDVIGIGETEDFYVISSNQEKTVLLAKYNLLVGEYEDENNEIHHYNSNDSGYGLQSIDAVGGYNRMHYAGTVAFSATNYWDNGTISYDNYPYVYDSTYTTAPNFTNNGFNTPGYSIAYYVEQYRTKLIEMGAPSTITGRLLSYREEYNTMLIYENQDYWSGNADNNELIMIIHPNGETHYQCNDSSVAGVRPVIEIPTSELQ